MFRLKSVPKRKGNSSQDTALPKHLTIVPKVKTLCTRCRCVCVCKRLISRLVIIHRNYDQHHSVFLSICAHQHAASHVAHRGKEAFHPDEGGGSPLTHNYHEDAVVPSTFLCQKYAWSREGRQGRTWQSPWRDSCVSNKNRFKIAGQRRPAR